MSRCVARALTYLGTLGQPKELTYATLGQQWLIHAVMHWRFLFILSYMQIIITKKLNYLFHLYLY